MATPTDLVNDYINARIPKTPYTQEQSERYSAEADDGNNDAAYSRKKQREYDEEPIPTRKEYEQNQIKAEKEIEYNSQQELDDLADDLDQSEPDYNDDDNYLEDAEFSGNYFEKPDAESEPKSSLGNKIREKYNSFSEKIANSAGSAAGSFVSGFNKKMDSFERGDPLLSTKRPATKKRSIRYVSRPTTRQNKNLSRPYVGGRFDDSFTLGTNANTNPYYPVNAGRQSFGSDEQRDLYLPSETNPYTGEFSNFNARNEFKNSKYADDEANNYDPFGFGVGGRLSADGFDNMSGFGDSLLGGVGNNQQSSIFGGMSAGTDTVFGDGAMFNAPRGKAKKESSGFGLDMIIGDTGRLYNTSDPSPRKPKTKRKSASKTAKKVSKTKPKRRASPRKQSYNGFVLP